MKNPPSFGVRILHWFCSDDLVDEIEGDLFESFQKNLKSSGATRANLLYFWNVILFFRPFAWKKKKYQNSTNMSILKNYFIVSIRNLRRKSGYTFINIAGLATGLACCIVIMLYVNYETSYENFQKEGDDIYRVALERIYPDRQVDYCITPQSFGPIYVDDFPEVTAMTRVGPPFGSTVLVHENQFFNEENLMSADSTLFDIFTFDFIVGNPKEALKGTNSMIMNETKAMKYFGTTDALGKVVKTPFLGDFQVTGVFRDYPENSHIDFEIVIPIMGIPFLRQESYATFSVLTYIKVNDSFDPVNFETKLPELVKKYAEGEIQRNIGMSYDEYLAAGNGYNYFVQPMNDIHLHSDLQGEVKQNGSYNQVVIFIAIAFFILILACINFMNLSTARSTERSKEVGIRKVLGSLKGQLVGQFLTESILVAFLSLMAGFGLIYLILPYFSYAANVPLSIEMIYNAQSIILITLGTLFIGILAGIYPAFVLSSFKPVSVLKGRMALGGSGINLRNGLVVFQFTVSIILISSTLIIQSQMDFLLNKDMGFDTESMLIVDNAGQLAQQTNTFSYELRKNNEIKNAGFVSAIPGTLYPGFLVKKSNSAKESYVARMMNADVTALQTMSVQLKEGRLFDEKFNDSLSVVINESAAEHFGYSDPVGKKLYGAFPGNQEYVAYTVVGVVRDYHFHTLHRKIEPQVIRFHSPTNQNSFVQYLAVKINTENYETVIKDVEEKWSKFVPNSPFNHFFIDDHLSTHYETERRSGSIFYIFTTLAIIIACIGLFSLSAYMASLKRKEIGVRKVLGSSVWSIVLLLSRNFTVLIGIAIVVALPVSYYWMDTWLDDFAYRIDVNLFTLFASGALALVIGWLTVSFQSIKAAIVNPTESLKNE